MALHPLLEDNMQYYSQYYILSAKPVVFFHESTAELQEFQTLFVIALHSLVHLQKKYDSEYFQSGLL